MTIQENEFIIFNYHKIKIRLLLTYLANITTVIAKGHIVNFVYN